MAASSQIIVTNAQAVDAAGSFQLQGVFWVNAPANNVVPRPTFRSVVANVQNADLAALRSGQIVEVPFTAPAANGFAYPSGTTANSYPAATTQATVDADLQAHFTAIQAQVTNQNPALSTAVNRAFNGASWAQYAGIAGALPIGTAPQIVNEFYNAVAQGLIPNATVGRAFGYVSTSATSAARILATTYAPAAPGVGAQRSVSSASASDAAAGTGARTVAINYLTAAFVRKQEIVTLNGVTAVNTVNTDIEYLESIGVGTSGSGLTNAGAITVFGAAAGGGGTLGQIAAGDAQTNWAHHYVPAGKTCYIINVSGGATAAAGRIFLSRTGDPSQTNLPILPLAGQFPHLAGGNEDHIFQVPVAVQGPDRIFLTEFPNAVTASVAFGAFEFIEL